MVLIAIYNPFSTKIGALSFSDLSLDGTKIAMARPKLAGFRSDGQPYTLTAERALQDVKQPTVVELQKMTGEIGATGGDPTRLSADSGVYDSVAEHMKLTNNVRIASGRFEVRLRSADIDFKTGVYQSDEPVEVHVGEGNDHYRRPRHCPAQRPGIRLRGARQDNDKSAAGSGVRREGDQSMTIGWNRSVAMALLTGMLILACRERRRGYKGREPARAGRLEPDPDPPGTSSKEPVSIDADKLVYFDKEKKAIYSGNVVVVQGDTKMTCSVMTVFLEKPPTPGAATPRPRRAAAPRPARASRAWRRQDR